MRKHIFNKKRQEEPKEKQPKVKNPLLQAYFSSLLCLILCVTMFFGTSYAWFTSEVTNEGNEIYIGVLDVELKKKTGDDTWASLSEKVNGVNTTKLFDRDIRWEPGYTALETVSVSSTAIDNLAFRYELTFTDGSVTGDVKKTLEEVAKWFDVWCYHDTGNTIPNPVNYKELTDTIPQENAEENVEANAEESTTQSNWKKIGSLVDVLNGKAVFRGSMTQEEVENNKAHTYTIALHMNGDEEIQNARDQEAFNDLMGQKIGLNVKLVATQLSSEEDAFGATYDLGAFAGTLAEVSDLELEDEIEYTLGIGGKAYTMPLDTAYQFQPNDTLAEALNSPYRYYIADFVVWADKDVPKETMALAGYYDAWCQYNDDMWVALTSTVDIEAYEEIRLVQAMGGGSITVNYGELCEYGNDGIGFLCGAADISEEKVNKGTTLYVELRLYETEAPSEENQNSHNVETGRYVTVGSYKYTFGETGTGSSGSTESGGSTGSPDVTE